MNRHLKVSLALATLSLATVTLLTGCGTDDLAAKVDDNQAKAEASLQDAIKKAETELAAAKAELQELVATGDDANAQELTDKISELTAAIEAAKKAASDADTASKTELLAEIEAAKTFAIEAATKSMTAAKTELEEAIAAGDLSSKDALTKEVATLNETIETVKKLASDADAALKAELTAAIDAAKKDASDAVTKAIEEHTAEMKTMIENGDKATDDKLQAQVTALNNAIEAAKTLSTDATNAVRDELTAAIAASKKETSDAIAKSVDALSKELTAKIEAGDLKSDADIKAAVADMTAAVELAKTVASDADAALKAELEAKMNKAVEDMSTAFMAKYDELSATLNKKIDDASATSAEELSTSVAVLASLIEAAETTAAEATSTLRADMDKAFADAKAELEAAREAVLEVVETKVAELKAEIEGAMASDKASAAEATAKLETMIAETKEAFAKGDADLADAFDKLVDDTKNEILADMADKLAALKAELVTEVQTGDAANASALNAAKTALESQIAEVSGALATLETDHDTLSEAVDALRAEIRESISAVGEAGMLLSDWAEATDSLVGNDGGMAQLKEVYESYESKKNTYVAGDFEKVEDLYTEYWVRMIRIANTDEIADLVAEFDALASEVRTIPDAIYDAIMDVAPSVEEVEYDGDKEGLDMVGYLIDEAIALNNADVMAHIAAYGDEAIDLVALYESYVDQYNALLRKSNGQAIKDRMDAFVANRLVWSDDTGVTSTAFAIQSIRADFDMWISDDKNALENVEGFADTYAQFVEAEARWAALANAKADADSINQAIEEFTGDVSELGATVDNFMNVESVKSRYQNWLTTYFSGDYANEIGGEDNYAMVDHDAYNTLVDLFDQKVSAFTASANKFAAAVDAIGDVNLMSWDEIDVALRAYGELVLSRDLADFNYLFNETNTPGTYYDKLVTMYAEYRTLKTEAYDAYVSAFAPVDGLVVSIYDGAKVDAILNWYATYGVVVDGGYTFDNGEAGTGYILSDTLTVDAADYAAIVELKNDYDALVADKLAEIADVESKIDAIGTVTVARGEYVTSVWTAYEAFLAGTKVADGYTVDQFKIVDGDDTYAIANLDVLADAVQKVDDLNAELEAVHAYIDALDGKTTFTDFADDSDRDTYVEMLATARDMIAEFVANNNGSDEGYITAAEYAKLDAGEFAVVKYDNASAINAMANALNTTVNNTEITTEDKTYVMNAVDTVRLEALDAIDAAADENAVDAAVELGSVKFDNINDGVATYAMYVGALNADDSLDADTKAELALKMTLSFEVTLNRVVESDNVEDVELNAKFVQSELESLYSIA